MVHRRQRSRKKALNLVDRTVYVAAHSPAIPEPDPTPHTTWQLCDRCNTWAKDYTTIPAFRDPATGTIVRNRQVVCACCAYGQTEGPYGPTVERCLKRGSCPGTCKATEIQAELRRLAGITETTEASTAQPTDLAAARAHAPGPSDVPALCS